MRFNPLLVLWLVACASGGVDYDPDAPIDGPRTAGKADDYFEATRDVTYGERALGDLGVDDTRHYRFSARRGDRFEVRALGQGGLNPHHALFFESGEYVRYDALELDVPLVIKRYVAERAGALVVAIAPFRQRSEGAYELEVRCTGGPCAGEAPPPVALTASETAACLREVGHCALEALPFYNGRVGTVRSEQIVQGCLARTTLEGEVPCGGACEYAEGDWSAAGLCEAFTQRLPFYADQSDPCLQTLDACAESCLDAAGNDVPQAVEACWSESRGCDAFALRTRACGGDVEEGGIAECEARCEVFGTAECAEQCSDRCDVDLEVASSFCAEGDFSCLEAELDARGALACLPTQAPECGESCGTFRVTAANLTSGRYSHYEGPGTRILTGLRSDLILVQELNYEDNSPDAFRRFTNAVCGDRCEYVRGEGTIPNGIVSRYPILDSGELDDPILTPADPRNLTRRHVWALIDVPGPTDVYALSVHYRTSGDRERTSRALVNAVEARAPANAHIVIGGDFNLDEGAALDLLTPLVDTSARPRDEFGDGTTNGPRSRRIDALYASPRLDESEAPVIVGDVSYEGGAVVDTRTLSNLSAIHPARAEDSNAFQMQHMAVVREFALVPE
ncbi:MAG: endonuclease/exonuclease/phosphatase family protein [Myxococcota bacterium]